MTKSELLHKYRKIISRYGFTEALDLLGYAPRFRSYLVLVDAGQAEISAKLKEAIESFMFEGAKPGPTIIRVRGRMVAGGAA